MLSILRPTTTQVPVCLGFYVAISSSHRYANMPGYGLFRMFFFTNYDSTELYYVFGSVPHSNRIVKNVAEVVVFKCHTRGDILERNRLNAAIIADLRTYCPSHYSQQLSVEGPCTVYL